jgi:hypothetical protein
MRSILLVSFALLASIVLSSASTQPYSRSFNSFGELRSAVPSQEGELVYLISYVSGKYKGGGQFVGSLSSATDDGGVIASNGTNFHWLRIVEDFETLTVLHFGAVHDGTTDDHDAVLRMLNWSLSQSDIKARNGIRLVEGAILISPIDISSTTISDFAIYGPTTPYGVRPLVVILSDKSAQPVFKVSAERVVFRGLGWDGKSTTVTLDESTNIATGSNAQPFFQNILAGGNGQIMQVHGFQAANSGGHVFDILDVVNSKFDQVYSSVSFANVWNIRHSGADGTEWDHPRSVEISNVNLQKSYGDAAIYAPRMEQGTLRNIWIEHSRNPGDISSGQWILDALNIESSIEPMNLRSVRELSRQLSLQAGGSVVRGVAPDGWLPANEEGYVRTEAYGILANAPVAALWDASMLRGVNSGSTSFWINVGRFETQAAGGIWEIEVLSKVGNAAASGVRPTNNGAPGVTKIYMQRGAATTPIVTYTHEGYAGVSAVRFNSLSSTTYIVLYVQFDANVLEYGFFARSTGITRYNSGAWNYFRPSGAIEATTPSGTVAVAKTAIHNGLAGIGAESNLVTIDTITVSPSEVNTTQIAGYMIQKINGIDYAVPYYEAPEDFPVDPPLGTPPVEAPTDSAPVGTSSTLMPTIGLICLLVLSAIVVVM